MQSFIKGLLERAMGGGRVFWSGKWVVIHRDVKGRIVSIDRFHNLLPREGLTYILNAALHGGTNISAWYFAPFLDSSFSPSNENSYASPGYTEITGYQESTRQEWAEDAASNSVITNSSPAIITAPAGGIQVYGAGIVGGGSAPSTKGDVLGGGVMLSQGNFTAMKDLAENETLSMTYTLTGSSV